MNWKGCGRKGSWHSLRYYTGIFLEGLRKTIKSIRIAGLWAEILNSGFSEYEAGVLMSRPVAAMSKTWLPWNIIQFL
jgi:hypothetical protein